MITLGDVLCWSEIKANVIKQWIAAGTRDKIATENGIAAGTVSNIVNEWKKGSDYESVRELAIYSKRQRIGLGELASRTRPYNYIKNIGANQDQIERFIVVASRGPRTSTTLQEMSRGRMRYSVVHSQKE